MSRFDKAAEKWDHSDRRQLMAANIAKAIIASDILEPTMELLDFGAGTGLLTKHLVPHVSKITALDLSDKMLEQLLQNVLEWNGAEVITVQSDIVSYQTDRPYDGIVSSMSMHHVQDLEALFKNFAHLLKPNGFIAIADLEVEDGTFHNDGNEGVYHFGFETDTLTAIAASHGFKQIRFQQVHQIQKENNKSYTIFLMLATKEV